MQAGLLDSDESGRQQSQQYLNRALELDPNLASAHILLADQLRSSDWEQARQGYERARQLAPNDPFVLQPYTAFLFRSGQHAEAVATALRLAELDPIIGTYVLGNVHHWAGNNDDAREVLLRAVERDPTEAGTRLTLGFVEVAQGNFTEALEQLQLGEQLLGGTVPGFGVVSETAYAYARAGSIADAERFFGQIADPSNSQLAHMALGS